KTLADEVADAVVKHPSLQVGFSRLKAIRKDELLMVFEDLASDAPMQPNVLSEPARKALSDALKPAIPGGDQTLAAAHPVVAALSKQFPAIKQEGDQAINAQLLSVRKLEQSIAAWFDTVMDRTSDSFARHTRMITIAAALLMTLTFQIDAADIWSQISKSPE